MKIHNLISTKHIKILKHNLPFMIMHAVPFLVLQPVPNPILPLFRRLIHFTLVTPDRNTSTVSNFNSVVWLNNTSTFQSNLSSWISTYVLISSDGCSSGHQLYHLINAVGSTHHNGLLPIQVKHFSILCKRQICVLFLIIHRAAMPLLFLITVYGLRSLFMVSMDAEMRDRQGFQKLLLYTITVSSVKVNPCIS